MTKAQWEFLNCALRAQDFGGNDGACAKGARQQEMAHRLSRAGLVRFVGPGIEEDGDPDREWPIYEITDAGRAALSDERESEGGGAP
jgi:hypothetical protein